MNGNRATNWFALLVVVVCIGPLVSVWLSVVVATVLFLPQVPTAFVGSALVSLCVLVTSTLLLSQLAAALLRLVLGEPRPRLGGSLCALLGVFGGVLAAIVC